MTALSVKVCGMRDALNVERIAALRPRYMGFIFVPHSPRYVGVGFPSKITRSLPKSIASVGVFQDEELARVVEIVREYDLCAVQLHGTEDDRYFEELRRELPGASFIHAVSISGAHDFEKLKSRKNRPDMLIFDNGRGGSGEPFDWRVLGEYRGDLPYLLAGGVGPSNLEDVLVVARKHTRCIGVDVNSKYEVKPGLKDEAQVGELLRRVQV